MGNIGPLEIGVVLIIALLVLGPKKLPQAGRGMGEAIRGFKDSLAGEKPDDQATVPAGDQRTNVTAASEESPARSQV